MPDYIGYDNEFTVGYTSTRNVMQAMLVRPGSITHHTDTDQRLIHLEVSHPEPGSLRITAPARDLAPPGYYMLFLLDDERVPSHAAFVRLGDRLWEGRVVLGDNPGALAGQFEGMSKAWKFRVKTSIFGALPKLKVRTNFIEIHSPNPEHGHLISINTHVVGRLYSRGGRKRFEFDIDPTWLEEGNLTLRIDNSGYAPPGLQDDFQILELDIVGAQVALGW